MNIPRHERREEHAPGRPAEYHRERAAWWFAIYFNDEYDAAAQNDAFHEGVWHQIQALEADIAVLLARPEPAPLPKRHTFGGVVFEETGKLSDGGGLEWILGKTYAGEPIPVLCTNGGWKVLRAVALEGQEAGRG